MSNSESPNGPLEPESASAQQPSPGEAVPAIMIPPGAVAGAQQISMQQVQFWQGQFPPPDAIERYERTLPGSFDRLISMAERAQAAQIDANNTAMSHQAADNRRGQILGFLVTVVAILGAIGCAFINQPIIGSLLVGVPVLAVAKALVDSAQSGRSRAKTQ